MEDKDKKGNDPQKQSDPQPFEDQMAETMKKFMEMLPQLVAQPQPAQPPAWYSQPPAWYSQPAQQQPAPQVQPAQPAPQVQPAQPAPQVQPAQPQDLLLMLQQFIQQQQQQQQPAPQAQPAQQQPWQQQGLTAEQQQILWALGPAMPYLFDTDGSLKAESLFGALRSSLGEESFKKVREPIWKSIRPEGIIGRTFSSWGDGWGGKAHSVITMAGYAGVAIGVCELVGRLLNVPALQLATTIAGAFSGE